MGRGRYGSTSSIRLAAASNNKRKKSKSKNGSMGKRDVNLGSTANHDFADFLGRGT